jgi:NAD+ diphosphatase
MTCSASDCRFVHWNNPIPVVAGLVRWADGYLLARSASWPPGIFSLLTGFLESGEHPETGIAREIKEELGVRAESTQFIGHYPLPQLNQLIIAYVVSAKGELALDQEIAEVKLVSADELENFDFGPLLLTKTIVSHWLSNHGGGSVGHLSDDS